MTVAMIVGIGGLAIVLIALQNLFFKVQKVSLKNCNLDTRYSKRLYFTALLVSLNMSLAFLSTAWVGLSVGLILFIIFSLVTIFLFRRWNWLRSLAFNNAE